MESVAHVNMESDISTGLHCMIGINSTSKGADIMQVSSVLPCGAEATGKLPFHGDFLEFGMQSRHCLKWFRNERNSAK